MKPNSYVAVSGTAFGVVALAHVVRLVFAWPVRIGQQEIPVWFSIVGLVLAGALCFWALRILGTSDGSAG